MVFGPGSAETLLVTPVRLGRTACRFSLSPPYLAVAQRVSLGWAVWPGLQLQPEKRHELVLLCALSDCCFLLQINI